MLRVLTSWHARVVIGAAVCRSSTHTSRTPTVPHAFPAFSPSCVIYYRSYDFCWSTSTTSKPQILSPRRSAEVHRMIG